MLVNESWLQKPIAEVAGEPRAARSGLIAPTVRSNYLVLMRTA